MKVEFQNGLWVAANGTSDPDIYDLYDILDNIGEEPQFTPVDLEFDTFMEGSNLVLAIRLAHLHEYDSLHHGSIIGLPTHLGVEAAEGTWYIPNGNEQSLIAEMINAGFTKVTIPDIR